MNPSLIPKDCPQVGAVTPIITIIIVITYSIKKHLLIGPDAYPLESIKLHIAWFAGRDVAKHTARGKIDWLTGSDVRTSVISHDPSVTSTF